MNYIYLRSQSKIFPLAIQEKVVDEYIFKNGYKIDQKKIELTPYSQKLEEREDFIKFLHSLKDSDNLFIYDLSIFSLNVGEIIKVLNCFLKKDINIHICRYNVILNSKSPTKNTIYLLNEVRENCKKKLKTKGRPKGSLSKSKYDIYKDKIISLLKEGKSVNEISKILNISRSSLRDYIVSRDLKELAAIEGKSKKEGEIFILPQNECKIEKILDKG